MSLPKLLPKVCQSDRAFSSSDSVNSRTSWIQRRVGWHCLHGQVLSRTICHLLQSALWYIILLSSVHKPSETRTFKFPRYDKGHNYHLSKLRSAHPRREFRSECCARPVIWRWSMHLYQGRNWLGMASSQVTQTWHDASVKFVEK